VVLYALLYGTVPFKANSVQELHQLIIAAKYKMKEDLTIGKINSITELECRSMIKGLLEKNVKKRLNYK
jgi:hypothetical protein